MLGPLGIISVIASLVLFAAQTSAAPSGPTDALAARDAYLGNLDMNNGCAFQYGEEWKAGLDGDGPFGWYCYNPNGEHKSVNVDAVCWEMYTPASYAKAGEGAFDWGCYLR